MIDIHSHILPGFDDGARDITEAIEMLQIAAMNGTTGIVATPHCNIPGLFTNYLDKNYVKRLKWLRKVAKEENIPIQIFSGMEVFTTPDVVELLKAKKLVTINNSKYILMEFDFGESGRYATKMLAKVKEAGYIPVVAHVERYQFVQKNPEIVRKWVESGYKIQVNNGSFDGKFGSECAMIAYYLLENRLITVVASDAHGKYNRTPNMRETYELLCSEHPETYIHILFATNPARICRDEETIDVRALSFGEAQEEKAEHVEKKKKKKSTL